MKNNLRVIIISMGVSRIVEPIVENYNVVGIIESASRITKKSNKVVNRLAYAIFRKGLSLENYSEQKSIPYYYMDKGSTDSLAEWVDKKKPDVIVVYAMSQLLKENIFSIPKYGAINLHPAFLPDYRGANPWFWSYYNTLPESGVTLHYMDKGEDTGDIIYQKKYTIPLGMKSPDMQRLAISEIGVGLIRKALDNIYNLPRIKQPIKSSTLRARRIKTNEHKEIIDWNSWSIERIWHLLRGTEEWLNALPQQSGLYKGQRWSIENLEKSTPLNHQNLGKIYKDDQKRYYVSCRDGKIYVSKNFRISRFIRTLFNS